jgi:ABC-type sugar transport system permease subunit
MATDSVNETASTHSRLRRPRSPTRIARRLDRLTDRQFALLAFLPGALLVAVIVVPPVLAALASSLFSIELLRSDEKSFVGLDNFRTVLEDPDTRHSLPITAIFAVGTTCLALPLALATALVLKRRFRGSQALAVAILLPWAVAPVVTGLFWRFIFNSSFGLVNGLGMLVGVIDQPVAWLQNTQLAVLVGILATVWRTIPLLALLLLAALRTVPDDVYRSAAMDGATAWQSFRRITVPAIRPTLIVVCVLQIILSLQVFDVLFTLTAGGPGRATTVISLLIYERAMSDLSFGTAAALAVVLTLAVALVASIVLLPGWLRRRRARRLGATPPDAGLGPRVNAVSALVALGPLPPARRRLRISARWPGRVGLSVARVGLALWLLGPIAWIVIASVQPESAVTQAPPDLTASLTFSHYTELLGNGAWRQSTWVSVQVAVITTAIAIVVGVLAAYPLARFDVPGKRAVIGSIVLVQLVPPVLLVAPTLVIAREFELKDTITALVLVNVAFTLPLVVWLLIGFFRNVPRSLEHAARIDGCSRLGAIVRISTRIAAPGIAAAAILLLIGTWNEFLFALVLGDDDAVTVTRQIGFLPTFAGPTGVPPYTVLAAAGVLATLPCFALVALFHRWIVAGLTEGYGKY